MAFIASGVVVFFHGLCLALQMLHTSPKTHINYLVIADLISPA